jgi:hypothetical protein
MFERHRGGEVPIDSTARPQFLLWYTKSPTKIPASKQTGSRIHFFDASHSVNFEKSKVKFTYSFFCRQAKAKSRGFDGRKWNQSPIQNFEPYLAGYGLSFFPRSFPLFRKQKRTYDNKAYTITSIYNDRQLQMFTIHPIPPIPPVAPTHQPGYSMNRLSTS